MGHIAQHRLPCAALPYHAPHRASPIAHRIMFLAAFWVPIPAVITKAWREAITGITSSHENKQSGIPTTITEQECRLGSTQSALLLIHQHNVRGFQTGTDRRLHHTWAHTLELGDHLSGLLDLSRRGTPFQRHQTPLRLQ